MIERRGSILLAGFGVLAALLAILVFGNDGPAAVPVNRSLGGGAEDQAPASPEGMAGVAVRASGAGDQLVRAAAGGEPETAEPESNDGPGAEIVCSLVCVTEQGQPIRGVQLHRVPEEVVVTERDRVGAISDEHGVIDLDSTQSSMQLIAFHSAFVPSRVTPTAERRQEVVLAKARSVEVTCLDDAGAPVPGCRLDVTLDRMGGQEGWPHGSTGFANPFLAMGTFRAVTNKHGQAVVSGLPAAEVYVRARWDGGLQKGYCAQVLPTQERVQITLYEAWGVVVSLPHEAAVASWRFRRETRRVDRSLYAGSKRLAASLSNAREGVRAYVVPSLEVEEGEEIHAVCMTESGELYRGSVPVKRLRAWSAPVTLTRASGGTGWLRVDVTAGLDVLRGYPIAVSDRLGQDWDLSSGEEVELPAGDYTLEPRILCPGLSDDIEAQKVQVTVGGKADASVRLIRLMSPVGWLELPASSRGAGITVQLESGDGLTCPAPADGRLALPAGRHSVIVSKRGWEAGKQDVLIKPGATSTWRGAALLRRSRIDD